MDCGKAFENVLLEAMVFQLKVSEVRNYYFSIMFDGASFHLCSKIHKSLVQKFDLLLNGIRDAELNIALKMISFVKVLDDIASNNRGQMLQKFIKPKGEIPVIGGKEINRFGFRSMKGFLEKQSVIIDKGQITKKSVLAQNIIAHITKPFDHIKITACIPSQDNCVITDTINQISITDDSYSQEFVWSLLNSKLINWYAYRFIFGKAIRTMHFDSPVTSRIPIPKVTTVQQTEIAEIVDEIIEAKKRDATADTKELERKIDCLVYQLYGLTKEEIAIVEGRNAEARAIVGA